VYKIIKSNELVSMDRVLKEYADYRIYFILTKIGEGYQNFLGYVYAIVDDEAEWKSIRDGIQEIREDLAKEYGAEAVGWLVGSEYNAPELGRGEIYV
jgi:hypothetical protein